MLRLAARGNRAISTLVCSARVSTSSRGGALAMAATKGAPQGALSVPPDQYPLVRRDESVVDQLHGEKVADPYRWLEDPDSKETEKFVEDQNVLTASVLAQCKTRGRFKELMTELYDYPKFGCPSKRGRRYVYSHNSGLQPQSVLYSVSDPDPASGEEPVVLLDPNKLSADGTVALGSTSFSDDGTLMAYTLSSGGSDWRTIHVMKIDQETGQPTKLDDEIKNAKFTSLAWTKDGKGFFYHRYPTGSKADGTETDSNVDKEMWYHKISDSPENDTKLFVAEQPTWHIGAEVTDDGRYLLIATSSGCEPKNKVFYTDLESLPRDSQGALDLKSFDLRTGSAALPVVRLVDNFDASYDYVANEGSSFTFLTNHSASRYKIIRGDLSSPPETWADLIPEHPKDLLQWAAAAKGDALVACYLRDVQSALELRKLSTGELVRDLLREVEARPLSVSSAFVKRSESEAFFSITAFTTPGMTFRMDLESSEPPKLLRATTLKNGFDPSTKLEAKQCFARSKDGTRIPMFLISPVGTKLDGSNPTLLYGYGGFNISLEPSFSVARTVFALGYDGVVAVANLRGGGEYGTSWRDAGSVRNKQNVFDDFQACAEYLIEEKWTSPAKLVIQGGSNGGLLVAACANQRPDLFAVVLAQVGVHDMLRFHKFTIGHAWVTDYGSPDDPGDFEILRSYSPVHNVRRPSDGGQYPAFMITTGDHDDRVVPLHSHKLTATLQHELAGGGRGGEGDGDDDPPPVQKNPIVTRIDVRAGHGAGKPTEKIIDEVADMFSFAAEVVGAEWKGLGTE